MSTIGKFFVVLNLALAALFVGVSASLIGTGESWREQAETADATHTAALADKDKALAATTAEREQLREEKSRLLTENNGLKADNKALTENLETESQKNSELTEKLTGIESKLGDLESTNRDQAGQLENMRRTANQMRDERDAAMDARDAAQSAATQAQQSERLALGRMKDLEQQLATASQRADKAETERDVVVAATRVDPSEISVQPMLEGTVLSVDKSGGATFVVIDLGKKDSVKIGYTFDVYDGATYKGKIRVETVNQGSAGASVTLTGTAAIAAGDRVTTRL